MVFFRKFIPGGIEFLQKGNKIVLFNPLSLPAMSEVIIYTDGSSRGNPGPGGYGVILMWNSVRKELSQGYRKTTNNRMELLAVIVAL